MNRKSPILSPQGTANPAFDSHSTDTSSVPVSGTSVSGVTGPKTDKKQIIPSEEEIPPFLAVVFSWPCLLSLVTMCITAKFFYFWIIIWKKLLKNGTNNQKLNFKATKNRYVYRAARLISPIQHKYIKRDTGI